MLSEILKPVEKELQSIQNLIERHLTIKTGYLGSFAHLEMSSINKTIRPALVVLSSRIYDYDPQKTIVLASVFQFIYMASKVHQRISENDSDYVREGTDPRDGSQFPVLVGDYLYSKFFYFLNSAGIISLLHPLAEIICQIHEGNLLKKKFNAQSIPSRALREVVRKETAALFAGCCILSARLAGAPEKDQNFLMNFGQNLGMAYGLLEQGISLEFASAYLEEALNSILMLPDKLEKNVLEELVRFFLSGNGLPVHCMVV